MQVTSYGRERSGLFAYAPSWLLMAIEDAALAPNFHKYGLLDSTFQTNKALQDVFNVISYSWDRDNQKYVAIMESAKLVELIISEIKLFFSFEYWLFSKY